MAHSPGDKNYAKIKVSEAAKHCNGSLYGQLDPLMASRTDLGVDTAVFDETSSGTTRTVQDLAPLSFERTKLKPSFNMLTRRVSSLIIS